jgi:hypothetical protein
LAWSERLREVFDEDPQHVGGHVLGELSAEQGGYEPLDDGEPDLGVRARDAGGEGARRGAEVGVRVAREVDEQLEIQRERVVVHLGEEPHSDGAHVGER